MSQLRRKYAIRSAPDSLTQYLSENIPLDNLYPYLIKICILMYISESLHSRRPSSPSNFTPLNFDVNLVSSATFLGSLFGKSLANVQKSIYGFQSIATSETFITETAHLILQLSSNDIHPTLKKSDFDNPDQYLIWKNYELNQLNQLCQNFISKTPSLSHLMVPQVSGNTSQLGSTFIPPDPRSCYYILAKLCLERETRKWNPSLKDSDDVLSDASYDFLQQVAVMWRIPKTTQSRLILAAGSIKYIRGEINVKTLIDLFYYVEEAFEPSAENDPITEWSGYDKNVAVNTMSKLWTTVLNELFGMIKLIFHPSKPRINPFHELLEHCIPKNVQYNGLNTSARFKINTEQVDQIKELISIAAIEKCRTELEKYPQNEPISSKYICDLINSVSPDIEKMFKKYKVKLFNTIDIAKVAASSYLTFFSQELKHIVIYFIDTQTNAMINSNYQENSQGFASLVELYHKITYIEDLHKSITNVHFTFDVDSTFSGYIDQQVDGLKRETNTLITAIIQNQKFTPSPEAPESLTSASVFDLFSLFHSAINGLVNLNLRNEVQAAVYYTEIIKV